ncbi:facilitated trehalose transporter Tret1-like [Thrips palmi]|uniref:Facilitated trehalose transporter Tret1-like n=1 Tax=Thrips palmi TaxID=161013 RepID=A0A6P8YYS1_THRPL|nr:facilitated trehalose transporter Tret1-like [Thrips palmi]XP_034245315.1 facilitated trehalose transporter Tret1-like [Thrips palmi]
MAGLRDAQLETQLERQPLMRPLGRGSAPGSEWTQHLAAILGTLLSVSAGTVLGWTSPALPLLGLPEEQQAWVGSLAPLGALLGALPAGLLAERVGRRRLLIGLGLPYLAGFLMLAFADASTVWLVYAGRLTCGVSMGASTLVLPLYCDEVAEDRIRGALGVYLDLNMTVGILLVYVLGAYLSVMWMSLACAGVPLLFLVTFPFMPESPVHLLAKGRHREASESLAFLRPNKDFGPEMAAMQKMVDDAADRDRKKSKGNLNGALQPRDPTPPRAVTELSRRGSQDGEDPPVPATARAVCLVLGLMGVQQLCGINAIIFYTVDIFEAAGSSLSPWVATMIVGAVQVAASVVSFFVVDRAGRRPLLATSCLFMALSLSALALYFYLQVEGGAWGALPVAALSVYIFFYSWGFGPLPWFMMAELLPVDAKDWGSALAIATNWALVFLVTNTFQGFIEAAGTVTTYALFAGVCLAGLTFVGLCVPETKGRSQEDIQTMVREGRVS